MANGRWFTVAEADALLPAIAPLLERLRAAAMSLVSARRYLRERIALDGGGAEGTKLLAAVRESEAVLAEIRKIGVLVRDPGTGLVDFPSLMDGREVYLCWRLGEEHVEWWHPTDTGVAGRQRLPER